MFPLCTLHSVFIFSLSTSPLSPSPPPPAYLPWLAVLQAAQAVQLQRAGSCDALLVTAAADKQQQQQQQREEEEEDGTGMELTKLLDRIRAQCDQSRLPGPGQRHISSGTASHLLPGLPSHAGAAAAAVEGGAVSEVATHSRIFSCAFVLCLCHSTWARCQPDTPSPQTPDLSTTKADGCMSSAAAVATVRCFVSCC